MKKTWWMSAVFILIGASLVGAATQNKLPSNYWDFPQATKDGIRSHEGLDLENNMRPEACAQCHQEQFNAWRDSRHAHAYSAGLVGQFPGMGHGEGNACLVCHAPLAEQLYRDAGDMQATLSTLLQHPEGFSRNADLDSTKAQLPLRHAGVTCAVCHVRQGRRFGPPRRGSALVGALNGAAHDGFIASKDFEQSQLCASCHQFPQSYAINGKPLENTVFEWKQSRFARQGIQCQNCHMPDRKHAFKGIHDVDMVRSGLQFELKKISTGAALTITSVHIGHAFPSYVTPKVLVKAEALDGQGEIIQHWQWLIVREVGYDEGWKEIQDTRLMPSESRVFEARGLHEEVSAVRFYVDVIPDAFYKGVYQSLLTGGLKGNAKALIQRALSDANDNDYRLYNETFTLE
ncbi:MAG: multiheme c-type cytochrome [Mariprofundaceae bacterium]|nr:multiheme c-type cytochrome [Mariprofundaceae bacterium]